MGGSWTDWTDGADGTDQEPRRCRTPSCACRAVDGVLGRGIGRAGCSASRRPRATTTAPARTICAPTNYPQHAEPYDARSLDELSDSPCREWSYSFPPRLSRPSKIQHKEQLGTPPVPQVAPQEPVPTFRLYPTKNDPRHLSNQPASGATNRAPHPRSSVSTHRKPPCYPRPAACADPASRPTAQDRPPASVHMRTTKSVAISQTWSPTHSMPAKAIFSPHRRWPSPSVRGP